MLNMIKDMIKQKNAFQEAADLILENEELDDSIILLHEESDLVEDAPTDEPAEEPKEDDTPAEGEEPAENGDEKPEEAPEEDKPEGDILDQPVDDELPEPVGAQTGEPAEIGDGDLLSVEIDLATNTPNDILPVPPAGAADAVPGADTTRVDSGFSTADVAEEDDSRDPEPEEEAVNLLDLPIDEEAEIPDPNGVAKKEEKPEEKAREDATPAEKTDEFKEGVDLLDESIDDVEEETEPEKPEEEEKKEETETEPAAPTEEKCEKADGEECKDGKCEEKEEAAEPKTDSDKVNAKFDKMGDLANMSAQQIKASIDPGIKAKLESAGIFDQFVEAITIGGDAPADDGTAAPAEDMSADVGTEPAAEPAPEDNAVTAAVKDKLGEMNSSDGEANASASKDAIMKKLSSLTKAIEDTKNLVMDSK